MKRFRYAIEYAALALVMAIFRCLPARRASSLGGALGRGIGPRLAASRKAVKNIHHALPDRHDEDAIIAAMWDHLGRVVAEYPHLETLAAGAELRGLSHLQDALRAHKQIIVFSGHIGNWEIMAPRLLQEGIALDLVYRAPNNPRVDRMLDRFRSLNGKLKTLPKSRTGTRQLVESLRGGRSVGILIDQKYNEGLSVPFFGRPAMTSPAFVALAQKYHCGLVPFRVERLDGERLRLSFFPALPVFDDQDAPVPVENVIARAHALLESWIAEKPGQWLWLHRRWGKGQS